MWGLGITRLRHVGSITLASLFFVIAVTPLFDLGLLPVGRDAAAAKNVTADYLYLFVVCSATFANLATFCIFYLRRRRPLSSVAPLLFFCSWTLIFQPAFVLAYQEVNSQHIMFYLFTLVLVLVLYRENKNEAKTIFVNEW